jgi:hypothetical protein
MGATKTNIAKETNGNLDAIKTATTLVSDTIGTKGSTPGTHKGFEILQEDSSGKNQTVSPSRPLPATEVTLNGAITNMTITNFSGLTASATVGWQSDRVDNRTVLAKDYLIGVKCTMPAGAPGGSKVVNIFICAWWYDSTSAWVPSSLGTATAATGSQGGGTIATLHNLKFLGLLNHVVASSDISDTFFLSSIFGPNMPDGWSIFAMNDTGQTITTAKVNYKALNINQL